MNKNKTTPDNNIPAIYQENNSDFKDIHDDHKNVISRFKKYLIRVIHAPKLTLGCFIVLNYFIIIWQSNKISNISNLLQDIVKDISDSYEWFISSIFVSYLNTEEPQTLSQIVNSLSFILLCYISYRFILYLYKRLCNFTNKHENKYYFYTVLLICYAAFSLFTFFNTETVLRGFYRISSYICSLISDLLFYVSARYSPTRFFGVNLLIRYCIAYFCIYAITKITAILNYLFFEKVVRDTNNQLRVVPSSSGIGTSRIAKFIYDEKENKLNIVNISEIFAVLITFIIFCVDIFVHGSELQIIEYMGKIINEIFQISQIGNAPFQSPLTVSVVVNVVFRFVSCGIYSATIIIIFYLLKTSYSILKNDGEFEDKHKDTYRVLAIMTAVDIVLLLWIYLISGNAGNIQNSGFSIFKTILFANVIIAFAFISIYILFKYSRKVIKINVNKDEDVKGEDVKDEDVKDKEEKNKDVKDEDLDKYSEGYILKKITADTKTLFLETWKMFVKLIYKILYAVRALLKPIFAGFYSIEKNDSVPSKILMAAANFCAIASQITTFLGLIIFFKKDIITWNIAKSILTVLICFCLTTGVQYILFATGTNIGNKIRNTFVFLYYSIFKKPRCKHLEKALSNWLAASLLLLIYLIPMTISSIFSFSSLFGGVAAAANFRNTVNTDVWNVANSKMKKSIDNVVNIYNISNNSIAEGIDKAYYSFLDIDNALKAWESANMATDTNNKNAQTVDSFVFEYNDQITGIDEYKNILELVLLDDINTQYILNIQEQEVSYKTVLLYNKKSHIINYLTNEDDNRITSLPFPGAEVSPQPSPSPNNEENNSAVQAIVINPLFEDEKDSSPVDYGKIKTAAFYVTKYQLIDTLFHEYANRLALCNSRYEAAKSLTGNSNVDLGKTLININDLLDSYSSNISVSRNIFDSFVKIREDIYQDTENKSDTDRESNSMQSVAQLPSAAEKYTHYDKEESFLGFDRSIDRITSLLSYLPDASDVTNYSNPNSTPVPTTSITPIMLTSALPLPTAASVKADDTIYDDTINISSEIKKINNYYNYADSRNSTLAFGLDVLYHGSVNNMYMQKIAEILFRIQTDNENLCMNPYVADGISTVYTYSSLTAFLILLAYIIDLLPIIVGIFVGKSRTFRLKRKLKIKLAKRKYK